MDTNTVCPSREERFELYQQILSTKNQKITALKENEYLTEAERRMASESASSANVELPKVGIRTVIGELQAKLTEMKQRFAEIRTRFKIYRYI